MLTFPFGIRANATSCYADEVFLLKLLSLGTTHPPLSRSPFPHKGRLFVSGNRLFCASNIVCDDRLDGSSRAPTPTGSVKSSSPPTLSEGQAIKITPDRAVLARVRSRRYFYWKAQRAEAVGCITPSSKVFGVPRTFFKKGSWKGVGQRPTNSP